MVKLLSCPEGQIGYGTSFGLSAQLGRSPGLERHERNVAIRSLACPHSPRPRGILPRLEELPLNPTLQPGPSRHGSSLTGSVPRSSRATGIRALRVTLPSSHT